MEKRLVTLASRMPGTILERGLDLTWYALPVELSAGTVALVSSTQLHDYSD